MDARQRPGYGPHALGRGRDSMRAFTTCTAPQTSKILHAPHWVAAEGFHETEAAVTVPVRADRRMNRMTEKLDKHAEHIDQSERRISDIDIEDSQSNMISSQTNKETAQLEEEHLLTADRHLLGHIHDKKQHSRKYNTWGNMRLPVSMGREKDQLQY
ncbi:hypothetical protein NDU88_011057 [Pleurodeles waltl]|uniref:Uncharacterized protein n=1 Tax=Pleurodeles waltl TaxID=8319 RepID=A0AAV7S349_PLEWA|nr:hypothetical protein NDU88_011057 [Pleurodeles waltl]